MGGELELRRVYSPIENGYERPLAVHDPARDLVEAKLRDAQKSRRRAWLVTWALILICAGQAAAIAIMLPLRDIVPYTILVDRQTGYVETARGLQLGELREDEALVHSFLAQYVMQRETFDPADFENRYERVALWSAEAARASFVALYQAGSADSILDDVRAGETISVTIKQIELLDRDSARVRFTLVRRSQALEASSTDWQAHVSFRFTGAPMRMEDRLINPLGFQVVSYRRDAEAPTMASEPVPGQTGLEIRGSTVPEAPSGTTQATPPTVAGGGAPSRPAEQG